jgi:hypothetical protein
MSPWQRAGFLPSGEVVVAKGNTYAMTTVPFDGWVKIGRTSEGRDPQQRVADCQTGNARQLELRAVWAIDVEPALHQRYAEFRGWGEWFALPSPMVSDMRRYARREKPWEMLFLKWSPAAVWHAAGPHARRKPSPEKLARIFMTAEAAQTSGEAKVRSDERAFLWNPDERDRRLLLRGQALEIVVAGELVSCAAQGTVSDLSWRKDVAG